MSKWHLINVDVLPVKPQTPPPTHKSVGYTAAPASQMKTSPEEKKNVASPCFISRRRMT